MPLYYLDIETTGLDPFTSELVTLQILDETGEAMVVKDPKNLDSIKPFLEKNTIVGHNLKFDSKFLKHHFGITLYNVYDTYLAEVIISGGQFAGRPGASLKDLVFRYCGITLDKELQCSFIPGVDLTPEQMKYATDDLKYLPVIKRLQEEKIKKLFLQEVIDIEMKCLPSMVWLELSGISIDLEKLEKIREIVQAQKDETAAFLMSELDPASVDTPIPDNASVDTAAIGTPIPVIKTGRKPKKPKPPERLNINSTQQLAKALGRKGIVVNGTSAEELSKHIGNPIIDKLFEYKQAHKMFSTYVSTMPEQISPVTGRVHASFMQLGAKSGRMSSKEPNLQNQPRDYGWREIFVPGSGNKFVVCDFSQIELRIAGELSEDPTYINAYQNNVDVHSQTARTLYHLPETATKEEIGPSRRNIAKTTNFGLNYGMSPNALKQKIKLDCEEDITLEQAKKFIREYQKLFPLATRYFERIGESGLRTLQVRDLTGRLCLFENPWQAATTTITSQVRKEFLATITKDIKKTGKELKWTPEQITQEIATRLTAAELEILKQIRKGVSQQVKKIESHIQRESKNIPIQALCAAFIKIALAEVFLKLEPQGIRCVNVVHDEIVLECREDQAEMAMKVLEEEMVKAGSTYLKIIPCVAEAVVVDHWTH